MKEQTCASEEVKSDTGSSSQRGEVSKSESFLDFVRFAVIAAAIVVPIRLFIAEPFIVSGSSMVPTYESGNYLIIDEVSYRFEEPRRGDVIVFRFPSETSKFLIKRIAALPGETIEIFGDTVTIYNKEHSGGFVWEQGAIHSSGRPAEQTVTLKDDEYFVLGDNRDESADSRLWGPLRREYITGRPILRLFPVTKVGILPGKWEGDK
jgi:signal peptidase I